MVSWGLPSRTTADVRARPAHVEADDVLAAGRRRDRGPGDHAGRRARVERLDGDALRVVGRHRAAAVVHDEDDVVLEALGARDASRGCPCSGGGPARSRRSRQSSRCARTPVARAGCRSRARRGDPGISSSRISRMRRSCAGFMCALIRQTATDSRLAGTELPGRVAHRLLVERPRRPPPRSSRARPPRAGAGAGRAAAEGPRGCRTAPRGWRDGSRGCRGSRGSSREPSGAPVFVITAFVVTVVPWKSVLTSSGGTPSARKPSTTPRSKSRRRRRHLRDARLARVAHREDVGERPAGVTTDDPAHAPPISSAVRGRCRLDDASTKLVEAAGAALRAPVLSRHSRERTTSPRDASREGTRGISCGLSRRPRSAPAPAPRPPTRAVRPPRCAPTT